MPAENTNTPVSEATETSFISAKETPQTDSAYSDFFQETSDGNLSIWPKAQKSGLEILTTVLSYVLPVVIIVFLFGLFHVFIRWGGGAQSIKEKYTFLCPYLTYGITGLSDEEISCQSMKSIEDLYMKKKTELETNIVDKLAEYIPIKITRNLLSTSPEKTFVIDTYKTKIHMDTIMDQFEKVRKSARSAIGDNIICNGMSITWEWEITTQCTVYGAPLGSDDENGRLGSARIEALKFVDILSETSKSQFILMNPPVSLSMEDVNDAENPSFQTRTSLSIQARYVPFNEKS